MLHARTREYRELLASDKRCERVYRRYAGVYIISRINTRNGVYGRAVDIAAALGIYLAEAVYRSAEAVENSAENLGRQRHLHRSAGEHGRAVAHRYSARPLKDLNDHKLAVYLDYTPRTRGAVIKSELDHFLVARALDAVKHDERTVYLI